MNVGPRCFAGCRFLTGPTAAGKTEIGLAVAERIDAEIVSMDSMAVYRGMDIGTAKPSARQRHRVPCHLIDIIDPWQEFSLAEYIEVAARTSAEIRARGRRVLFVGGTPLYLKALLRGIFDGPPADWALRAALQREAAEYGPQRLHDRLRRVDAAAADRLHPNDLRRVIRAIEVFQKTGVPISGQQQQFGKTTAGRDGGPVVACLSLPRERLYERIDRRSEQMFGDGLIAEVESLSQLDPPMSRVARQSLGYKEVLEYLKGVRCYEETVQLVQRRTRRFAKHQLTWFRSLSECRFVRCGGDEAPQEVAALVGEMLFRSSRAPI